jgi:ribosome biogenesis protein
MDIDAATPSTSQPLASLHLHTGPGYNQSHRLIGFWDTSIPSSDEVPEPVSNERDRKKRSKIEESAKPRRKAPLSVFKSHTARLSKVSFAPNGNGEKKKAYSCGFDSTVKLRDTEYGICEYTIVSFVLFPVNRRPLTDVSTRHLDRFLNLTITPNGRRG